MALSTPAQFVSIPFKGLRHMHAPRYKAHNHMAPPQIEAAAAPPTRRTRRGGAAAKAAADDDTASLAGSVATPAPTGRSTRATRARAAATGEPLTVPRSPPRTRARAARGGRGKAPSATPVYAPQPEATQAAEHEVAAVASLPAVVLTPAAAAPGSASVRAMSAGVEAAAVVSAQHARDEDPLVARAATHDHALALAEVNLPTEDSGACAEAHSPDMQQTAVLWPVASPCFKGG